MSEKIITINGFNLIIKNIEKYFSYLNYKDLNYIYNKIAYNFYNYLLIKKKINLCDNSTRNNLEILNFKNLNSKQQLIIILDSFNEFNNNYKYNKNTIPESKELF